MKIKEINSYLLERFPLENACDFDNGKLGFVIGDEERELTGILLALDLNNEVLEEAIEKGCNFIITHHPFLWFPTHKVLLNTEKGGIINKMMKNDINLFSMHTNLDCGIGGVNDSLCKKLGFTNIQGVAEKDALMRTGSINPTALKDFAKDVLNKLNLDGCRIVGDPNKIIKNVAIIGGGSGSEPYIYESLSKGCDCYICGEMRLSAAQAASFVDMAIIEVNHGVEKVVFEYLLPDLEKFVDNKIKVYVSDCNTDPLHFITKEA